jgi:ribosomal protein S18 acetylase RimI-like enzyme
VTTAVLPLFVGCGRSGTTLLRAIFDSHSDLAIAHEAHFIAPAARRSRRYEESGGFAASRFVDDLYRDPNFRRQGLERRAVTEALDAAAPRSAADAVRTVLATYSAREGKRLYGDKTPGYVTNLALLARFLPEARFVHIVRDGRDVALSYLERPEWGPRTVSEAAFHWKNRVGRGRRDGAAIGSARYLEIMYENLVSEPEETTHRVCAFLNLDFQPSMLDYHVRGHQFAQSSHTPGAFANLARPVTGGLRDWRVEMTRADQELFEAITGHLLGDLGYEIVGTGGSRARIQAALAFVSWQKERALAAVRRLRKRPRGAST